MTPARLVSGVADQAPTRQAKRAPRRINTARTVQSVPTMSPKPAAIGLLDPLGSAWQLAQRAVRFAGGLRHLPRGVT